MNLDLVESHSAPGPSWPEPDLDLSEKPAVPARANEAPSPSAAPPTKPPAPRPSVSDGPPTHGPDGPPQDVARLVGSATARAEEIEAAAWRLATQLVLEARKEASELRAEALQVRNDARALMAEAETHAGELRAEAEAQAARYRNVVQAAQQAAEEKLLEAIALERQRQESLPAPGS